MYYSNYVDNQGRALAAEFSEESVTRVGGLPYIVNRAKKSRIVASLTEVLNTYLPRNGLRIYGNEDLVTQILAATLSGYSDLNDVEILRTDPGFAASITNIFVASAPTLSRFYSRFEAFCREEQQYILNKYNLKLEDLRKTDCLRILTPIIKKFNKITVNEAIRLLKKRGDTDIIIIDVDSTPIELQGKQDEGAFDGHYKVNCYLPIVFAFNGIAAMVQNAPGAANGAKLCQIHITEILHTLRAHFPKSTIIFRADTGYNCPELINFISTVQGNFKYIIGYDVNTNYLSRRLFENLLDEYAAAPGARVNVPQAVMAQIAQMPLDGLFVDVQEPEPRKQTTSTTFGGKFRCCGILKGYKAKSWNTERTLVYRLQYNPDYDDLNLRFIQTNLSDELTLKVSKLRGVQKNRSLPTESLELNPTDAKVSVELYEEIFCSRGQDERLNCEWKSACGAARCSLGGFFSNSLRMIFSLVAMQIFEDYRIDYVKKVPAHTPKKTRKSTKPNITRSHCAKKRRFGPTIELIQKHLICLPAKVRQLKTRLVFHLPLFLEQWQKGFLVLME